MNALLAAYPECPAHFERALTYNGLKELLDDGTLEPRVRALFEHTHFPPGMVNAKTAWCAAFVCAVLELSGIHSTRSAAAASYTVYGTDARDDPQVGDVVVMRRGVGLYHVTFWAGPVDTMRFLGFGGNQRDAACMEIMRRDLIVAIRRPPAA